MKKTYKDIQKEFRALRKPQLLDNYKLNSFGNRRTRRQSAKRSGYFQRDKDGNTGWPNLKPALADNVQTLRLTPTIET